MVIMVMMGMMVRRGNGSIKDEEKAQPDEDTHRGDKKGPYEPPPIVILIMCHELTLMFTTQMMK